TPITGRSFNIPSCFAAHLVVPVRVRRFISECTQQSGDTIMSDLSGKTALITGALTGIGRATALAFAQEGSRVMVSGRRDDAGQALVTELRALGAEAEFVRADVRRED